MKTEHTQGPWQVMPEEEGVPYIRIRGTVLGGRYKVANVHMETYEGAGEVWNEKAKRESRANARLICSAPEMLAALGDCLGNINPERGYADELEATIRAAIAKATGGPT